MRVVTSTIAIFVLLTALTAPAQFSSVTNGSGVTITGYTGPSGAVVIPTNFLGMPVTAIANAAFYERYDITSLALPDTVTNLGEYTFFDCANLSSVTMPAGLIAIGDYTFENCYSLTNLTIPGNVTTIGTGAFADCSSLSAITLSSNLAGIGIEEFSDCSSLTNVTIPGGVTSIGEYAFSGCAKLKSVAIPGGVTNIGYGSFLNCSALAAVTMPNCVTGIGQYAFYNCPRLASVYFNGGVPGADPTVFAGDQTTAYYLPTTGGWTSNFAGIPTAYWPLPNPMILNGTSGINPQTQQFGFNIFWATNTPVIVQASSDLATWTPIATNVCTNGMFNFSDPQFTNYPARFYRVNHP